MRHLAGSASTDDSWRLDKTVHPFATARPPDIRLTTHHREYLGG